VSESTPPVRAAEAVRLTALADGFLTTQLLYVAVRLRLADVLADGPRSAVAVASAVGGSPGVIRRVLRGLCLDDVFVERGDGLFGLGTLGELLRDGVPGSQRGPILARGEIYYAAAAGLLAAATDGASAFEAAYGQPFFAHLDSAPDHAAVFQASMAGRAGHEAAAVVAAYDFGGLRRLVDVGAGSGLLTGAALRAAPELTATLVDRPAALSLAREQLSAAGLASRCTFEAGDFFAAVPAGGDGYLLSRVLHDWDDADAARILGVCRAAMAPEARLIVVDALLPARARDLPAAVRMDLHMLVLLGAAERTEVEMRGLLTAAGFEVRRIVPTGSPTGLAVIEAARRP